MRVRKYLLVGILFVIVCVFFIHEKQNDLLAGWNEGENLHTEVIEQVILDEVIDTALKSFLDCKKNQSGNVRNIYLIKSFKAASSTLSNMLFRYGLKHRLNFIQPKSEMVNQIFPYSCSDTAKKFPLIPSCNGKYNLHTIHSRFDGRAKLAAIMPEDTLIIGSVRNPVSQMMSSYNYLDFGAKLSKMNITFENFIEKPVEYSQKYFKITSAYNPDLTQPVNLGIWNQQSQVYGLSDYKIPPWIGKKEILANKEYQNEIEKFLTRIDQEVDFVFITENFIDSVAIFMNIFDMDLSDVAYLKLNEAKQNNSEGVLTTEQQRNVIEWNYIDWLLYQRMLTNFNKLKLTLKFNIKLEVDKVNGVNMKILDLCLKPNGHVIKKGANCMFVTLELSKEGMNNACCSRIAEQEWDINRRLKRYMNEKIERCHI